MPHSFSLIFTIHAHYWWITPPILGNPACHFPDNAPLDIATGRADLAILPISFQSRKFFPASGLSPPCWADFYPDKAIEALGIPQY